MANSAAPEQTTGNSIGWQVLVGAVTVACELSRDRAQFARVFPVPQDAKRRTGQASRGNSGRLSASLHTRLRSEGYPVVAQ